MAADWESSSYGTAPDSDIISETGTAADDGTWDSYPDYANSADGNSDSLGDCNPAGYDLGSDQDEWDNSYPDTGGSGESDLWGDTYPDAAYSADSIEGTGRDDGHEPVHPDSTAADNGADNGQPEQAAAAPDGEHTLTPEQERISELEAELAETTARFDELKASTDARMDRFEAMLAEPQAKVPDGDGSSSGERSDATGTPDSDQGSVDPAVDKNKVAPAVDEQRAERERGRRFLNADNIGVASAALGSAEALEQFALHASPDSMVVAGVTVLGLVGAFMAKREKKMKG